MITWKKLLIYEIKGRESMDENKPAIEIIGEEKCTGCFGCYNSCPHDAIEMKYSEEGFFVPKINDKCTYCGICQEHCPVIQNPDNSEKFGQPIFYGGKSTNKDVILNSSSGGLFPEIAKSILNNSGVVFGVCLEEDLSLEHIKIENSYHLSKIMGSKYIQSEVGDSYQEVLKELKNGKKVLFSGTPCQISALNTFTNHDNLYTIDLACHGVPSRILFDKYIEHMEEKRGKQVKHVNFRDKAKGWNDYQMKITFDDGSIYEKNHRFDPFFRAFLQDLCLMEACYECKFNEIPRPGDISLGDFWGRPPEEIKDPNGVSVILVNNNKGKELITKLRDIERLELCKTDFETATKGNPRLKGYDFEVPAEREKFFQDLKIHDFEFIDDKYLEYPNPVKRLIFKYLKKIRDILN